MVEAGKRWLTSKSACDESIYLTREFPSVREALREAEHWIKTRGTHDDNRGD